MKKQQVWISAGYKTCSSEGFSTLKVERLAKAVGVSKSSFYHYFADLDCFMEDLCHYHFSQCAMIADKEKNCTNTSDLIDICLEHKTDLLFHRQLRINRENTQFEWAFIKAKKILGNYAMMPWAKEIHPNLSSRQLEGLFNMITDNFYMQINEENLNREFLSNYLLNLRESTKQLLG